MSHAVANNGHAPRVRALSRNKSSNDKLAMPKAMKRIEVYVPTTLNNVKAVPVNELRVIQERVMNAFGGYTLHPYLRGGWLDENRHPFQEPIFKIEIDVMDDPQSVMAVVVLANFIRQRLGQKAIFVTIEDVGVFLI